MFAGGPVLTKEGGVFEVMLKLEKPFDEISKRVQTLTLATSLGSEKPKNIFFERR